MCKFCNLDENQINDLSKHIKILGFYRATLVDIMRGICIDDIKKILKEFEDMELYEECEGINRALKFYEENKTYDEIRDEYNRISRQGE